MSQTASTAAGTAHPSPRATRPWWALGGVAAGALGFVATGVTDPRSGSPDPLATITPDSALFTAESVARSFAHLGVVVGYVTVALLIVLAAAWRQHVEPRVPASTAARVVSAGLVTSAGALALGYGWKGALAIYLPGGMDAGAYDPQGLFVYYMLNDFGGYIGWIGVTVSAGAMAWMALRERTVAIWIGVVSLLPVLATALYTGLTGLPGAPALTGPFWMVIAFAGLAFGRSAISR